MRTLAGGRGCERLTTLDLLYRWVHFLHSSILGENLPGRNVLKRRLEEAHRLSDKIDGAGDHDDCA